MVRKSCFQLRWESCKRSLLLLTDRMVVSGAVFAVAFVVGFEAAFLVVLKVVAAKPPN